MVVQHNISAMNASKNLAFTSTQQKKAAEKLSSGYRINRAGDDAAGLVKSEAKRSEIKKIGSTILNQQETIAKIQEAEGSLQEAHAMAQRIVELEERGGTESTNEIASIKTALTAMVGNATTAAGELPTGTLTTPLASDLGITSASGGEAIVDAISNARAKLGYAQNVSEYKLNDMKNREENLNASESAIRDTDMASEMVKFTNANILVQAGQSMVAQANQLNQGVLSLLG